MGRGTEESRHLVSGRLHKARASGAGTSVMRKTSRQRKGAPHGVNSLCKGLAEGTS